jgi:hypothetical protein
VVVEPYSRFPCFTTGASVRPFVRSTGSIRVYVTPAGFRFPIGVARSVRFDAWTCEDARMHSFM